MRISQLRSWCRHLHISASFMQSFHLLLSLPPDLVLSVQPFESFVSLNVSKELEFPPNDGVQKPSFWGLKLISNGSNRPFLSLGHAQNFSVAFILEGCIYFASYCLIIHDSHPYVVVANIPTTYF